MISEVQIQGRMMGSSHPQATRIFLVQLLRHARGDLKIYQRASVPGIVFASEVDWVLVLGIASSVVTVSQAIWWAARTVAKGGSHPPSRETIRIELRVGKEGQTQTRIEISGAAPDQNLLIETLTNVASNSGTARTEGRHDGPPSNLRPPFWREFDDKS